MNKTYTPELAPEVLLRLRDYADQFRDLFRFPSQVSWSGVDLRGLLQDGERKSIEPRAARVPLPAELSHIQDPEQALQQFLSHSPWDERAIGKRYRSVMARRLARPRGIFVSDEAGFPKQGKHSVGVPHQSGGPWGQQAHCQVAVTVHDVSPQGHFPAARRLDLPASWIDDPKRLDRVGVPPGFRSHQTKGPIAREWLDPVRAEGRSPGEVVITDAGSGVSQDFREGLAQRPLHSLVGVTEERVVFTERPTWVVPPWSGRGRRPTRPRLADGSPRPVSLKPLAARTRLRKVPWREGTKGELAGRFAWLRVWPGQGWATGDCAAAEPLWLLIEGQADGEIQFASSNLPATTRRIAAVRLRKGRWPVEQGDRQMKEELGLDHFAGRSWRGFHHHACLVMLASGFLVWEPLRAKEVPAMPGKKSGEAPRITVPAIRRALQGLLSPRAKPDCEYCNPHYHLIMGFIPRLTE